jgi:hypothetical protein
MAGEDQDAAWAAGYFSARGGVFFSRSQVRVIVTDKHEDAIRHFAGIVGCPWLGSAPIAKGSQAKTNTLTITAQAELRRVLEMLRPLVVGYELTTKMDAALAWLGARDEPGHGYQEAGDL